MEVIYLHVVDYVMDYLNSSSKIIPQAVVNAQYEFDTAVVSPVFMDNF